MKNLQVLGAAVLLFQLAAGGDVIRSSRDRRTLYSSSGEQAADIDLARQAASPGDPAQAAAALLATESMLSATPVVAAPAPPPPPDPNVGPPAPPAAAGAPPPPPPPPNGVAPTPPAGPLGPPRPPGPPGPPGPEPAGMRPPPPPGAPNASAPALTNTGTAPPPAAAMPAAMPAGAPLPPAVLDEINNVILANDLNIFFIASVIFMLVYRLVRQLIRYVRTVSSLNNPRQEFYMEPSEQFAGLKKNIIHAPMFSYRRAQESRPHPKIHAGALPTRFQALYLVVYLIFNIGLVVIFIHWDQPLGAVANQLKNRTGTLAAATLGPLIFVAGRQNPFQNLLHLPYDTFNTLHRWFARMLVLLVAVHSVSFSISLGSKAGFAAVVKSVEERQYVLWGFIAFVTFLVILIQASSPIRHAAYEVFKLTHIALVALALTGIYIHVRDKPLNLSNVRMAIAIWAIDRIVRVIILIKTNIGKQNSRATIEALPGDAVKVTLELTRPWKFKPGQHLYLYMPSLSFLQSHPFSIAWSTTNLDDIYPEEKTLPLSRVSTSSSLKVATKTKFELIIKSRDGFTKRLVQKAQNTPGGKFSAFAMAEGPFGGHDSFTSYGTVLFFAGGVGITHIVPYINQLVHLHSKNTIATRRIVLIWTIPRPDALNWIAPWMQEILQIPGRRECLRLLIYVTRMGSEEKMMESPSSTITILSGRPDVGQIMDWECGVERQVGAVGVGVCGSGGLADEVRRGVRERQMRSNIDFIEESFSW